MDDAEPIDLDRLLLEADRRIDGTWLFARRVLVMESGRPTEPVSLPAGGRRPPRTVGYDTQALVTRRRYPSQEGGRRHPACRMIGT